MSHTFEVFKYLIKEKMVGEKPLRENLTFLNYWVSSWLNFRFGQIPQTTLNFLFIPAENIKKRKDYSERQGLSLSHHHKGVILSNVNKRLFFLQLFGIKSLVVI